MSIRIVLQHGIITERRYRGGTRDSPPRVKGAIVNCGGGSFDRIQRVVINIVPQRAGVVIGRLRI